MGVIATAMGILYGALFGEPIHTFLPYVATGLLIWNFINGCILEGSEVFIANEGLIRFLPAPISLHVYRLVWRQTLFFLHNLVIWAPAGDHLPAAAGLDAAARDSRRSRCWCSTAAWIAVLSGIVATRFRDIPPIIASLTQLLFFMTPIVWSYDALLKNPRSPSAPIAELNPVMHFVEILRAAAARPADRVAALGRRRRDHRGRAAPRRCVCLRNYRSRVAYWV